MHQVSGSLETLLTAQNDVLDIAPLGHLSRLTHLDLSGASVSSLQALKDTLPRLPMLRELKLIGSPVCKNRRYREAIILSSRSLSELDSQDLSLNEKRSTQMRAQKLAMRKNKEEAKRQAEGDMNQFHGKGGGFNMGPSASHMPVEGKGGAKGSWRYFPHKAESTLIHTLSTSTTWRHSPRRGKGGGGTRG